MDNTRLPKLLNFMRAVWGLDHGLQARSKRMLQLVGITGPQRVVVRIVGRFPGISAGELAAILHLDKSTVTGIVRRLEDQGAMTRKSDASDGRRALFTLTAKGRVFDRKHPTTVEAVIERTLAQFNQTQIEHARQVLDALAEALGE